MIGANIYVRELRMMAEIAAALGETAAEAQYGAAAARSAKAFVREFYRASNDTKTRPVLVISCTRITPSYPDPSCDWPSFRTRITP